MCTVVIISDLLTRESKTVKKFKELDTFNVQSKLNVNFFHTHFNSDEFFDNCLIHYDLLDVVTSSRRIIVLAE